MSEIVNIDNKYAIEIEGHGARVNLKRHGVLWYENHPQGKVFISCAYKIESLEKQLDEANKTIETLEKRELFLEATANAMYECFEKLDSQLPIDTHIGRLANGFMDVLFNNAEIRTDIEELVKIDV